jgi:hypothetical protein
MNPHLPGSGYALREGEPKRGAYHSRKWKITKNPFVSTCFNHHG